MPQLTPEGQQIVNDLSMQYGFSPDAITHMMIAVLNGNGSMAQFNHPEFAGSGQWMQGGMIMLGDMFNNSLKGSIDSLCNQISGILNRQPGLLQTGSFQSQSQNNSSQNQNTGGVGGPSSLFVPDPEKLWWPAELGSPNSTGSQNGMKYAYFSNINRLAIKTGNSVWVYDTLNHQIGGFSQQQGYGSSIKLSSQFGNVDLHQLPVVMRDGQAVSAAPPEPARSQSSEPHLNPATPSAQPVNSSAGSNINESSILDAIEKLGSLKDKGFLTEEEFRSKKAELLARL